MLVTKNNKRGKKRQINTCSPFVLWLSLSKTNGEPSGRLFQSDSKTAGNL